MANKKTTSTKKTADKKSAEKEEKNTVPFEEEEVEQEEEEEAPEEPEEEEPEEEVQEEEPKQEKKTTTKSKAPAKKADSTKKTTTKASSTNKDVGIEYQKMSAEMKNALDKQPKVQFLVPPSQNEKQGAWESVQINGHRMVIKKGVMVTIPQQVAQILADHYQIQMEAGQEYAISNKGQDVEDALS